MKSGGGFDTTPRALLAAAACAVALSGCGGGGGGDTPVPPPVQNVLAVSVDAGPEGIPNLLFTTVTICAAGSTTQCQTIDHIQVDTGSSGLRIISSVLSPALGLTQQLDANGLPLVECAQFVDGFSWGPVKIADVQLGPKQASSVAIQVIGDPGFTAIPTSCSNSGPPENTVEAFGANGVLGVGPFAEDCGNACAQRVIPGAYYSCSTLGCQPVQVALARQLQNPVTLFASDNNGVVIQLPQVPDAGAASVAGQLIFGIGTQANNALGLATTLALDTTTGNLSTVFGNRSYPNSFVDSGSSAIFFGTAMYPGCTDDAVGLYCPATKQSLAATLQGTNNATKAVAFSVANADRLFAANPSFYAFDNTAGPNPDPLSFAWGLPFFYGRSVYTAIAGRSTPAGPGPYVAF